MDRQMWICERLKKMGYAKEKHIRLYGEKWQLTSNPTVDNQGFVVEAVIERNGHRRHIHIPLMTVRVLEHELDIQEEAVSIAA